MSLFTASVESLKCHGSVVKYRFACSHVRIAQRMLDILRKARVAMSHESLAVFHKPSNIRYYLKQSLYNLGTHSR